MDSPALRRALVVLVALGFGAYFLFVKEERESIDGLQWVELYSPPADTSRGASEPLPLASEPAGTTGVDPIEPARLGDLHLAGVVLDLAGQPVEGIEVERVHPYLAGGIARSAADGSFELTVEGAHGELAPRSPGWLLLGGERFVSEERSNGYRLVVAPAVELRGRVVDPAGEPIADAALTAIAPGDALVPLGIVAPPIEHEGQRGWSARDGSFRLGPLPFVPGTRVEATLTGLEPGSALVPADLEAPVVIVIGAR